MWSLPLRALRWIVWFLASMYLAFFVIAASAVLLAWATFIESWYGREAVAFGVYGAWWFHGVMLLLGINVVMAAVVRFPWKRRHTGFVITHAGIVILLVGCAIGARDGFEAFLSVFEGSTGHVAMKRSQHFELTITPAGADTSRVVEIPFATGPFNWRDLNSTDWVRLPGSDGNGLFWFPWRLAHRDTGVIYDADGIKLEVLDYLSDSRLTRSEPLDIRAKGRPAETGGEPVWTTYRLGMQGPMSGTSAASREDSPRRVVLPGGEMICSWIAGSEAEVRAFEDSRPEGALGQWGQVVLSTGTETTRLSVDELVEEHAALRPRIEQLERAGGDAAELASLRAQLRKPLGNTGLTVELDQFHPGELALVLLVRRDGGTPGQIILFATGPEFSRHDTRHGVFASYWVDPEAVNRDGSVVAESRLEPLRQPRVEILRGPGRQLHYRVQHQGRMESQGTLPADGEAVTVLEDESAPLAVRVERFVPGDLPGYEVEPVAFDKEKDTAFRERRVRVRLTVDGAVEEFWLDGTPDPALMTSMPFARRTVHGEARSVAVRLPWDQVDLGFALYLRNFQRKLDPGSSMASHYFSIVDRVDPENPDERLERDIRIDLNRPVVFTDPKTKRVYRLYQTSFFGPLRPGDPRYDELIGGRILEGEDRPRDELFSSTFTVNYDPGRGLKYLGSLLIVIGSGVMFYMRGYFSHAKRKRPAPSVEDRPAEEASKVSGSMVGV